MKILLVNPNRYREPPAPPIALEYLAGALDDSPHDCAVCDLCFSEDPAGVLAWALDDYRPDVAGVTIRNIDTVIHDNNIFFLDDIRDIISQIRQNDIPVVIGGAGCAAMPKEVLAYTGADWCINGPGEGALPVFLDECAETLPERGRVLNGWAYLDSGSLTKPRPILLDYERYVTDRGLAGFETQKGCMSSCSYCIERNTPHIPRSTAAVCDEIEALTQRRIRRFHLCDTEFNQDLAHCRAFLRELIARNLGIEWALYMKTAPYEAELFELIAKSGVSMITVSVNNDKRSLDDMAHTARLAKRSGLGLAVDFMCGAPGETENDIAVAIEKFKAMPVDTVGINTWYRLYPNLPMTRLVMSAPEYRKHISGDIDDSADMVRPVFYNHIGNDILARFIGSDARFTIEGSERTSNYERI